MRKLKRRLTKQTDPTVDRSGLRTAFRAYARTSSGAPLQLKREDINREFRRETCTDNTLENKTQLSTNRAARRPGWLLD